MIRFIISLLIRSSHWIYSPPMPYRHCSLPRYTPPATGINLCDHTRSLVTNMPTAMRITHHSLLHGNIDPSPPADIHCTIPSLHLISLHSTPTSRPSLHMTS